MRLALSALLIALCAPVWASQCQPRGLMVGALTEKYKEASVSMGISPRGSLVEVYASEETGTWTVLVTHAGGMSCIIAAGTDYQALDPPPKGNDL